MRSEFVPPGFAEQYVKCSTCELRKPVNAAVLEVSRRLRLYGQCLRQAKDKLPGLLQPEFEHTYRQLDLTVDLFRDAVEAERQAYGEAISQYFTSDQFGLGDTRLRRGVSANRQQWAEAEATAQLCDKSIADLETAHNALSGAYQSTLPDRSGVDAQLDYFMLYGFDPLWSAYQDTQQFASTFKAALALGSTNGRPLPSTSWATCKFPTSSPHHDGQSPPPSGQPPSPAPTASTPENALVRGVNNTLSHRWGYASE